MVINDQFSLASTDTTELYFTGLGCMMSWILVVQYFEGRSSAACDYNYNDTMSEGSDCSDGNDGNGNPLTARVVEMNRALVLWVAFALHSQQFNSLTCLVSVALLCSALLCSALLCSLPRTGSSSYYVLITTLRKGTPRVARFLVGVLPIFLGYALHAEFIVTAATFLL